MDTSALKKTVFLFIPILLIILLFSYKNSLFIKKEGHKDNVVSGSAAYIKDSTDSPLITSPPPATTSPAIIKKGNNVAKKKEDVTILGNDTQPIDRNVGEIFPIKKKLAHVETKQFSYMGLSLTPFDKGRKLYVTCWGIKNKLSVPVYANISLTFYDREKEMIGCFKKQTKKTSFSPKKDFYKQNVLDKKQAGTGDFVLEKNILKNGYDFDDVCFISVGETSGGESVKKVVKKKKSEKKDENNKKKSVKKISSKKETVKKSTIKTKKGKERGAL